MSSFGKIERHIALFANRNPGIKKKLKLAYQSVNYALYRKEYALWLADGVLISNPLPNPNLSNFWGYYDTSPERDGKFMSHTYDPMNTPKFKMASVMDISIDGVKVSETNAWNWQQGSRLHWMDQDSILHNVYIDGQYQCKILDINKKDFRLVPWPVFAYQESCKLALGLNVERLSALDPAYGYFAHDKTSALTNRDEEDGIFKIDLERNTRQLLLSFDYLKNFRTKPSMQDARHSVNHFQISPTGDRFMFLHRWYLKNGLLKSRLLTANSDGSDLFLLSDDDMVSHCAWKNEHMIIGWMRKKNRGDGYFLHMDQTTAFEQVGTDVLKEDGHPSFSPCGNFMLTDTYPDRSRMSHLMLYHLENRNLTHLASFFNPLRYNNDNRCDLHPRFSADGHISIDTVYKGLRKQVLLDISKFL